MTKQTHQTELECHVITIPKVDHQTAHTILW